MDVDVGALDANQVAEVAARRAVEDLEAGLAASVEIARALLVGSKDGAGSVDVSALRSEERGRITAGGDLRERPASPLT